MSSIMPGRELQPEDFDAMHIDDWPEDNEDWAREVDAAWRGLDASSTTTPSTVISDGVAAQNIPTPAPTLPSTIFTSETALAAPSSSSSSSAQPHSATSATGALSTSVFSTITRTFSGIFSQSTPLSSPDPNETRPSSSLPSYTPLYPTLPPPPTTPPSSMPGAFDIYRDTEDLQLSPPGRLTFLPSRAGPVDEDEEEALKLLAASLTVMEDRAGLPSISTSNVNSNIRPAIENRKNLNLPRTLETPSRLVTDRTPLTATSELAHLPPQSNSNAQASLESEQPGSPDTLALSRAFSALTISTTSSMSRQNTNSSIATSDGTSTPPTSGAESPLVSSPKSDVFVNPRTPSKRTHGASMASPAGTSDDETVLGDSSARFRIEERTTPRSVASSSTVSQGTYTRRTGTRSDIAQGSTSAARSVPSISLGSRTVMNAASRPPSSFPSTASSSRTLTHAGTQSPVQTDRPSRPAITPINDGETEVQTPFCVINSSPALQKYLIQLPSHVQREIARLVSAGYLTLNELSIEVLVMLRNVTAEHMDRVAELLPPAKRLTYNPRKVLWSELNKEDLVLRAHTSLRAPRTNVNQLCAGKVRFSGVWKGTPSKTARPELQLHLEAPTFKAENSCRISRRFGSQALLVTTMDDSLKKIDKNYLLDFFARGISIAGQVYHAFSAKDDSVFWITEFSHANAYKEPNEDFLPWFLSWHNDIHEAGYQSMGKWASRMQLSLSDSIVGPCLEPEHMLLLPDKISPSFLGPGKPPPEVIMTDGAGLMSIAVAKYVQNLYNMRMIPSAIQMRLEGAKGLYVLCPPEMDVEQFQVWTRPSQIKIKHLPEDLKDISLRTIDVLNASKLTAPSHLTPQLLINLAGNGVPNSVLCDLICNFIIDAVDPIVKFKGDSLQLCHALDSLCHLVGTRLNQMGLALRGQSVGQETSDLQLDEHPQTFEESMHACLLAGFSPTDEPYVHRKVRDLLVQIIKSCTEKCRCPVRASMDGFLVPDHSGVLQEGEIFVQFSAPYEEKEGTTKMFVEGDVLIMRHPCMLPTDVRKVKAVRRPEILQALGNLSDVIVCPTNGIRSLASDLGGGDHDGDHGSVIWDPLIFQPFQNADINIASEPPEFEKCLSPTSEMIEEFLERTKELSTYAKRKATQKYLLDEVIPDYVMQGYSRMHDIAIYVHGIFHETSVDFARKYCVSLDSAKTGLHVKDEVFRKDKREYSVLHPWKEEKENTVNIRMHPNRSEHLEPFILHVFTQRAEKVENELLSQYDRIAHPNMTRKRDEHLSADWQEFIKRPDEASRKAAEAIRSHVEGLWGRHKELMRKLAARDRHQPSSLNSREEKATLRALFQSGPVFEACDQIMRRDALLTIMASCAYDYDFKMAYKTSKGNFPFDVCHGKMCEMKAKACGFAATMSLNGYMASTIHPSLVKASNPLNTV